jgi:hypothetical protein
VSVLDVALHKDSLPSVVPWLIQCIQLCGGECEEVAVASVKALVPLAPLAPAEVIVISLFV